MGKSNLAHNIVPEHRKLKEAETKEILEKYNIKKKQLPKISSTDPAIKGLDAEKGDVIEIKRQSQTAGSTLYYRMAC